MIGVALIAGFRPEPDPLNWLAAAALLLALMTAISWMAAAFGLLAKTIEGANALTFVAAFAPYVSSAFVPAESMPAGLQWIAEHQPVTPIVDSVRALTLGTPLGQRAVDRVRVVRGGHRRRADRRRPSVPTELRPCSAPRRRPSAGSPSATSASTARPRAASRRPPSCWTPSARCAACSSTRPRSSRATTCSSSSRRHGAFDEQAFEQLAYADRALFEYWAHEASYVLSEDLQIHRFGMHEPRYRGHRTWWDGEPEFRAHILERLRDEGPLRAREIEDKATVGWESTGGWTNGRTVARMLDMMWVAGQTGISRRDGTQRVWDLMERCLPPDAPARSSTRWRCSAARWSTRSARSAPRAPRTSACTSRASAIRTCPPCCAQLHADGTIQPLAVEGLGDDWWILAEDVERLQSDDFKPRTVLLSPFDNLLCDRARTEALFGFHHRLEIYTPKPKRRWGYFVLPILDGDKLVARADLAMDRKRNTLVAHAIHAEPKRPARRAAAEGDRPRARAARGVARRDERRGSGGSGGLATRVFMILPCGAVRLARLTGKFEGVKRHGSSERASRGMRRPDRAGRSRCAGAGGTGRLGVVAELAAGGHDRGHAARHRRQRHG